MNVFSKHINRPNSGAEEKTDEFTERRTHHRCGSISWFGARLRAQRRADQGRADGAGNQRRGLRACVWRSHGVVR